MSVSVSVSVSVSEVSGECATWIVCESVCV